MAVRGAVLGARMSAPPPERERPAVPSMGIGETKASAASSRQRIATGATGAPVPPTNGSGGADSRKA
ncbi:hypothetical protein SVIO_064050 [Streptomyces violaceusniger]|uniref:Uncharacterized protein n=1 Tax=Streptomyces violaceusniger TaxID=68280 RepID=A0A4D4L3T8_STRVO|nr:hypothetical protein SVIO_064050 [Streptomyces violaceusniger]